MRSRIGRITRLDFVCIRYSTRVLVGCSVGDARTIRDVSMHESGLS